MIRSLFVVLCFASLIFTVHAQVQSNGTGGGNWNNPASWQGGVVPDFTFGTITILAGDQINVNANFTIDQTIVQVGATLYVDPGAVLTINNGAGTDITVNGNLIVEGQFVLANGSTHAGMTSANTSFLAGSIYRHQFTTTQGVIPLATWDADSEVVIEGYTSAFTATAAGNWGQDFGNFTWNCPAQSGVATLAGFLVSMNNVDVLSTGSQILRLSVNQNPTINIAGNLTIDGAARVDFSTTGTNTIVNIGGNLIYNSTNATGGGTRLTTTGTTTINLSGDFTMNAPGGQFNFAGGANGTGTLDISGNFDLQNGTVTESGGGSANGNIVFSGTDITHLFNNAGLISNTINYSIPASNTLFVLGESQLRGNANSSLTVNGTLVVQSENGTGAIFTGAGTGVGNVRVTNRTYNPGAVIIYGGTGPQFIGNGQPNATGTLTVINNPAGVSLNNTSAATVTIGGNLEVQTGNLTVELDGLDVGGNLNLSGGNVLFTTVGTARTITVGGNILLDGGDIVVSSGTANATLIINGDITGGNFISFTGANSNLIINGTGDLSIDFPLPGATTIEALTVNRAGGGLITFNEDLIVTTGTTLTAGRIRMNANLTAGGALNLGAGTTLFFEGQTLELRNQLTGTGLLSADASSTLNILNTGTLGTLSFSPTGNTLGTFYINRPTAGTLVTLNSPLLVENTFTLQDGDFLNTSGLSFGNGADVTRFNTALFSAGSAVPGGGPYNLFYSGTTLTAGVEAQGNIQNLTSNLTGTLTAGGSITVAGTTSINSGTFACGANTISTDILNLSGTLNAQTSTLVLTGNFINNGTFNRGTGTVRFDGNSSIGGLNNPAFQNVVINGILTPPSTFNIHGAFTNNGLFNNSGAGIVAFLGTAATPQVVSGSTVTNFHNISVSNTSAVPDVIIESNQNMTGVLTLAATATFDADGAANNRIFTMISSSDDPTVDAAIAIFPNAAAQVQGNVTVQRYMSLEGPNSRIYRYISSPIQSATVADIQNEIPVSGSFTGSSVCTGCTANPSMFRYDETVITGGIDDGYVAFPVTSNAETLTPGRGYAIFVRGNIEPFLSAGSALWNVRGPVNRDNVNYGVTFTSSGVPANDGWNLVGNPYPSTMDWDAATGWTRTNISATIYTRNNATGQYAVYTSGSGGLNGGSRYIAMGQGFWVQATGAAPNMATNENVKAAGTQTTFFRERSEYNLLKLALTNGSLRDEAIIHFRDDATDGFDFHADAWKLPNNTLNLSTVVEGVGKLAINSLGDFNCAKNVKLDVSSVTPGNYSIEFSSIETFESYIGLFLVDNFSGNEIDLRMQSSYAFQVTANPASYGNNRFAIRFTGAEVRSDFVVEADAEICQGSEVQIAIDNSQPNVMYRVFKGSVGVSPEVTGNGEIITINLPSSVLSAGTSNLEVRGYIPGCSIKKIVPVTVHETYQVIDAQGAERCLSGTVELSVANTVGNVLWYDNFSSTEPVGYGVAFTTPALTGTKTYYASVENSIGCEGERVAVQATIHQYEIAEISQIGNTLASNYATGNQWLFNGSIVAGATEQFYQAEESGLYAVQVTTTGGCITEDDVQFIFTAVETTHDRTIRIFPNPTFGKVYLEVDSDRPVNVKVFDVSGKEKVDVALRGSGVTKSGELDLTSGSDGIYILHILKGDLIHQVKIIKTSK
ncbi:MAG: T9SS type A sorting domain-containing protein [Cyclobacteriaceae bacterium]|nr:T9SS type A sorting domain-containing protein [Cyclobacteriaceae bacterium]UYN85578.1 MAG: T9SS type A sorting domain-containing protein [Cyclobacteriaceae bacterium]